MRARPSGTGRAEVTVAVPRVGEPGADAPGAGADPAAAAFAAVATRLREALPRDEVTLEEIPAPTRLAPHALAFAAEVLDGDRELASGRLVLLHDPAGQEGWAGDTRFVTVVQAPVEPEMAVDPLLGEVAWGWLGEALLSRGAASHAAGGTVTRTASTTFGDLAGRGSDRPGAPASGAEEAEVQLRASWSPGESDDRSGLEEDLVTHLAAWCDLLCAVAGLPPPGVTTLPVR